MKPVVPSRGIDAESGPVDADDAARRAYVARTFAAAVERRRLDGCKCIVCSTPTPDDGTCADDHDTQGRSPRQVNSSEIGVVLALAGLVLTMLGVAVSLAWPWIKEWFR